MQHAKFPSPCYLGMNEEERPRTEYLLCVFNLCEIKVAAAVFCFLWVPDTKFDKWGDLCLTH